MRRKRSKWRKVLKNISLWNFLSLVYRAFNFSKPYLKKFGLFTFLVFKFILKILYQILSTMFILTIGILACILTGSSLSEGGNGIGGGIIDEL